jgi:hypothetical protein
LGVIGSFPVYFSSIFSPVMHTTFIPSAQRLADDQPRFQIPAMPDHPEWATAVAAEASGGIAADIRIFLDAQLGVGDVLVDLDPGFGVVALSGTSAPGGMPTVFVAGLDPERLQLLQDAAVEVGGWLDELPDDQLANLAVDVESRLEAEGRVFVHASAAQLPQAIEWLAPLFTDGRVLAVCVSDAVTSPEWSQASAALASLQFVPCGIAEADGDVVVVAQPGAPRTDVIALPAELVSTSAT